MDETERLRVDNEALRTENEQLRRENEQLRAANADYLAALPPPAHRALRVVDAVSNIFSFVDVQDGCESAVAAICKNWRDAWRRRCRGAYRLQHVCGEFESACCVTRVNERMMVIDYGNSCLKELSPTGELRARWCDGLEYPDSCVDRGDGTLWVIELDKKALVRVRLEPLTASNYLTERYFEDSDGIKYRPWALAAAGDDALVILFKTDDWRFGRVAVLDFQTGAERYWLVSGSAGTQHDHTHELRGPSDVAVHGDHCFITDTYNQRIVVFDWRQRTYVGAIGRSGVAPTMDPTELYWAEDSYVDGRRGNGPGEFDEPVGIAVRGKTLFVSEGHGCRIQILRLPDDITGSPPEVLQTIPSPHGGELCGLCLDGNNRLWCLVCLEDDPYSEGQYACVFAPL